MNTMASQITSLKIVCLNIYSGADKKNKNNIRAPRLLCAENSRVTGEFPAQMASNVEKVSIWWRDHGLYKHVIPVGA